MVVPFQNTIPLMQAKPSTLLLIYVWLIRFNVPMFERRTTTHWKPTTARQAGVAGSSSS